ncbi:FKBP-type peptidyl-prolyl cis-trans isomerase [Wolbachia endosymbiont of Brugia pahangi]|uniref:FKBP-type peptidyl-prolyl cis-trans isomerase n=1 Tax=Wolbachia endosymbiont of Brugia pahangi TaxID=96495 RepID=UPI0014357C1A|nr:FKBP-type peptidyl-prolyl cis-trans isomerase [Wolbachia endosymbiont of Brugia pahangi]QIT36337.1 FKBP-type peptidyl-prolyl cis-trans isomerase family protein [Wolbachia endosymbiont of Brugia pahangi]
MARKIILQLLISIVIIFTLASVFVFVVVCINKGKPERKDKLYEINAAHSSWVQTIAYYLVKPILESALDRYIEKHGLIEYLKEIIQQKVEKGSINFYEIIEGSGSRAFCGQEVVLQMYKISDNLATPLPLPKQTSDVTLVIGQDNQREVGLGVIGMKEGGERVVTINNIANKNEVNFNSYYIKLIEVKDKYPDSVNSMMIFNELINKTGKQVKCGDRVSVKYSLMGHDGEYIIKNQTVQFKVGNKKVPLAMELGVIGMKEGNNRTIISPPELLNVTDDMLIENIDFDEESVSIISLSLDDKQEIAAHYSTVE